MLFEYGQEAIEHLSAKDPELAEVIDQVGIIERSLDDDLFPSVVHHIIAPSRPQEEARIGGFRRGCPKQASGLVRKSCDATPNRRVVGKYFSAGYNAGANGMRDACVERLSALVEGAPHGIRKDHRR